MRLFSISMTNRAIHRRIFIFFFILLSAAPLPGYAWNIPGHMLSGAITYQIVSSESPATIATIKAILQKHPWYETHWKEQLDKLPDSERDEMFFMLAPRWSDDIRTRDRTQHRGPWHYINWPFKPQSVETKPAQEVNILTALAENERIGRTTSDPEKKAIALTWLFHLVGDIHQPLHSTQVFTRDYPAGDRGGNEICVRGKQDGRPLDLHRFWDGVITSNNNVGRLRNVATELLGKFSKTDLVELASTKPEAWAKESFQIATRIAYQNGALIGTPKAGRKDCREISEAAVLPAGYVSIARRIADRRIMLAGYRLADLLKRL